MSLSRDRFPTPIVCEKELDVSILMSSEGLQNPVNNSEVRSVLLKKL